MRELRVQKVAVVTDTVEKIRVMTEIGVQKKVAVVTDTGIQAVMTQQGSKSVGRQREGTFLDVHRVFLCLKWKKTNFHEPASTKFSQK